MNRSYSYTAANSVPVKLFLNENLLRNIFKTSPPRILSIHLQFSPTNKCNLKCGFCSCGERDKDLEMDVLTVYGVAEIFSKLGCKAVTVTGGGEPLMHSDIGLIINKFLSEGIEVGLVTNGLRLKRLKPLLKYITWTRISCSDERKFKPFKDISFSNDFAFSYVVTKDFDPDNLNRYIEFANKNHFSHIRVVSDLVDLDNTPSMDDVKAQVKVDDSLVIYQGRKEYTKGAKNCWISLLKPVVSADGGVWPCCGVQYSKDGQVLDFPSDMKMGNMEDIEEIWRKQKKFDGSKCERCYYENYNIILDSMMGEIKHREFV